jgi:hypothetical protein
MKMSLNELRTIIKRIIREEQEDQYETKPVKNHGKDAKMNTHFAIHKATNAIATMWDYSDMYPEKPMPPNEPKDKTNKRAMTIYKNKMVDYKDDLEFYKDEVKEINDDFLTAADDYFYGDIKDTVGGNMKKFKKTDFVIVKKADLEKRGINLDDYLVFIGDKF